MADKEFLRKIWNLEITERPALVVEELTPIKGGVFGKSAEDRARASLAYYAALEKGRDDNIPAVSANVGTFVMAAAFGADIRQFEDGREYVRGALIRRAADVDSLKKPDFSTGYAKMQLDMVKYLVKETGGQVPIRIPDVQTALDVAEMLWDTDDFYVSLLDEPERAHRLLSMITEATISFFTEIYRACENFVPITFPGVWAERDKGIYLSDDTMSMLSPELYEEYGVRYNNIVSGAFGGVFLHSCSTKKPYFDSILKNKNLRSMNFAAQFSSDIGEIFEAFGGRCVVLPHYIYTDVPQIGTVFEFLAKIKKHWRGEYPAIITIGAKPEGGRQQDVMDAFEEMFG